MMDGNIGQLIIQKFFVTLEYNPYPFIISTLGR